MNASEILCQLIRIPSVNPMGGDVQRDICYEGRLSDWLVEFFESIGASWERMEVEPGRDNVIARYDSGAGQPTILLDAHQDTVPVVGMQQPFDPVIRNQRIFGRGACDVKGGMAAMLVAFERLMKERPVDSANVVISCSCDEEAGMGGVRHLVDLWTAEPTKSQLLHARPTVCVVAEPTDLDVVAAHLGVVRFRIRTTGIACHASTPDRGRNAIYSMAPVIQCLEAEATRLATESVGHPRCGIPTLSVGVIGGGTSVNIVPAECVIEVDRRLVPGEDPIEVWKRVGQLLEPYPHTACDPPWLMAPALSDDQNSDLANRLSQAIESTGINDTNQVGVSYCTNGSTIAAAGVPTVVWGPGSIAQAHTVDEFIDMEQLESAAEIYFRLCASYGIPQPPTGSPRN